MITPRAAIAAGVLVLGVLVMAFFDPHPASAGRSSSLLTAAAYPKVYVHALGGGVLYALLEPIAHDYLSALLRLVIVGTLGILYELIQWFAIGSASRGIFTWTEAAAVIVGAAFVALWQRLTSEEERVWIG